MGFSNLWNICPFISFFLIWQKQWTSFYYTILLCYIIYIYNVLWYALLRHNILYHNMLTSAIEIWIFINVIARWTWSFRVRYKEKSFFTRWCGTNPLQLCSRIHWESITIDDNRWYYIVPLVCALFIDFYFFWLQDL